MTRNRVKECIEIYRSITLSLCPQQYIHPKFSKLNENIKGYFGVWVCLYWVWGSLPWLNTSCYLSSFNSHMLFFKQIIFCYLNIGYWELLGLNNLPQSQSWYMAALRLRLGYRWFQRYSILIMEQFKMWYYFSQCGSEQVSDLLKIIKQL